MRKCEIYGRCFVREEGHFHPSNPHFLHCELRNLLFCWFLSSLAYSSGNRHSKLILICRRLSKSIAISPGYETSLHNDEKGF